jgi:hypothetical protein
VIQDAGVALGALKPILVSKKSIMNLKFNWHLDLSSLINKNSKSHW